MGDYEHKYYEELEELEEQERPKVIPPTPAPTPTPASTPTVKEPENTNEHDYYDEVDKQLNGDTSADAPGTVATDPTPTQTPTPSPSPTVKDAMDNVFGNSYLMSPEEQQRRIKRARTAALIGNLGQALAAFGNLFYVNKGAAPINGIKPISTHEDELRFIDRVNAARKEAYLQKQANDKLAEERKYRDITNQIKRDELEAKKPVYEAQARSYDALVHQRMAAAAYQEARAALAAGQLELAQRKLEEAERHNRAAEDIAQKRVDVAQQNADLKAAGSTTVETTPFGEKTTVVTPNNTGGTPPKDKPRSGNKGNPTQVRH